jgi:ABC-type nitrate/sulfonate/bicarbonate transport system permease component
MKKFINTDKEKKHKYLVLAFYIFLILLWEILVDYFKIATYILPSPWVIAKEMVNSFPLLLQHSRTTILEVLIGFSIALVLGIVLSVIMDRQKIVKKLLYPLMVVSQTIPIMAVAPLLMVWFGFGLTPKIIVVVLVCFFPMAVSFTEGLSSVDSELVDLMRTMKATETQIFLKCKLPASLPSFFSGLRIAATYSVMGAVVSEWVGAKEGLGIFMTRVMKSYRIPALFAVIVFIVVMTLIFVALIDAAGRFFMPWSKEKRSL